MKPSTQQLLTLLRRHKGLWVNHADLAVVGGHRYGGRIFELRRADYVIEQRGAGQASQYRLVAEPVEYPPLTCPQCGWAGQEPQAGRVSGGAPACPKCWVPVAEVRQEVLCLGC